MWKVSESGDDSIFARRLGGRSTYLTYSAQFVSTCCHDPEGAGATDTDVCLGD